MVTTFGRPGYLRRAMEAGASGFLVKDAPAEQLADAIRRVHAGLRVVDPALAAETLATGESPLTGRERDVLVAARDGGTVADIARLLVLSDGTVRNYLSSAMGKTGARTRAEAVLDRRASAAGCRAPPRARRGSPTRLQPLGYPRVPTQTVQIRGRRMAARVERGRGDGRSGRGGVPSWWAC